MIDKTLVKNSFKKNLKTYEDNAFVQKKMAQELINMLPCKNHSRVLEIGVGTGYFTRLLAENISYKDFFANDIVQECSNYLSKVIEGAVFVSGDIESVNIPQDIDLVVSNATLQWVSDLDEILLKISASLNKEGCFVFSTFGKKNFYELKDVSGMGLKYYSKEELKSVLERYFEVIEIKESEEKLFFNSFKELLKHIKLTGVNGVSSTPFSISDIKEIELKYKEKYFDGKRFVLTYNPLYVSLKKKS